MVNDNGTRVLINDTTNAIPAYQWLPTATAAYVSSLIPADNDPAAGPALVQATIVDGPTPVNTASVSLLVDGVTVAATVTKTDNETLVTYVPDPLFASGSTHTATLAYTDAGNEVTRVWTFTIAPYTKDVINDYVGLLIGTTALRRPAIGRSPGPITSPSTRAAAVCSSRMPVSSTGHRHRHADLCPLGQEIQHERQFGLLGDLAFESPGFARVPGAHSVERQQYLFRYRRLLRRRHHPDQRIHHHVPGLYGCHLVG
jgi:hypothetical protein